MLLKTKSKMHWIISNKWMIWLGIRSLSWTLPNLSLLKKAVKCLKG